ncbi:endonuclease/exonuclease/phosphatase family protein [Glycomyces halotolerans]
MTALRESATETGDEAAPRRRWCWATRIVVAAAIAWSAFLIAHLLLAGELWWWSVAEMIPPPAMALPPLVLAIAGIWIARGARWRVEVTAAASALLVAPMLGVNPGALFDGESDAGDAELTVFSWNTDYWHTRFNEPGEFYDFLLDQDADVFLLTEYLTRTDRVVPIDDEEALREHFEGWHIAIASEMVTISRFPIVEQRALDTTGLIAPGDPGAPPEDDWDAYWTTKILRTDLDVEGRIVSMYNLHLSVPVPTDGAGVFRGEFWDNVRAQFDRRAAQVDVLVEDLESNPNPVLVAGDVNSSAVSGAIATLKDHLDCPDPDGEVYPASWPKRRFGFPELWRLDWACVGGGAAVTDYRFTDEADLSDHEPQLLGLDLGER